MTLASTELAVLLGVSLTATACSGRTELEAAHDEPAIFVRQVLKLHALDCVAIPDPTASSLMTGVLDVALTQRYSLALLVGNLLGTRSEGEPYAHDSVALETAQSTITSLSGEIVGDTAFPTSGFVEPGAGEPGWGVAFTRAIDDQQGALLATRALPETMVLSVQLSGRTLGGVPVSTPPFSFTVEICRGCLIRYPLEADDPTEPGFQCTGGGEIPYAPCIVGQDDAVDCQLCVSLTPLCDAP